jgi:hypothetical protein
MTLGNMRKQGVRRFIAYCLNDACRHQALIEVWSYPASTESFREYEDPLEQSGMVDTWDMSGISPWESTNATPLRASPPPSALAHQRGPQSESVGTRLRARQLAYVTLAVTDTSFRNANSMELQRRCANSAAIQVFGQ